MKKFEDKKNRLYHSHQIELEISAIKILKYNKSKENSIGPLLPGG